MKLCFTSRVSWINQTIAYIRRHGENTDDTVLYKAVIKAAKIHYNNLIKTEKKSGPHTTKALAAFWDLKIAEYFYVLGENRNAFKYFSRAVAKQPSLFFSPTILKQIVGTGIPKSLRDKIKNKTYG